MLPHALATLRFLLRAPMTWGISIAGVLFSWFGAALAVLALHDSPIRHRDVIASSTTTASVVVLVWMLARLLGEDRGGGFSIAADATRPGPGGRLLGRWLGGSVGAALLVLLGTATASLLVRGGAPISLSMLGTSSVALAVVAGWAVLLGAGFGPGPGSALALLTYLAGHLPWGRAPLPEGPLGLLARAWLPRPPSADVPALGSAAGLLTAIGLALGAAWLAERARRADPMF